MKILETERLILRELAESDAAFMLNLLNQPSFIRYIGDRNVRDAEQASEYIASRFSKSYSENGFGLWAVELKEGDPMTENRKPENGNRKPIGICGFVKRDTLPDIDIGFAFLPEFERKGYAFESASAAMRYGKENLELKRVVAITTPDNESSGRLLGKLGFEFEKMIDLGGERLKLFSIDI